MGRRTRDSAEPGSATGASPDAGAAGAAATAEGKRPTVRAIAARLGLSPATVSSALTGRRPSGFVTEATRRQVWDAARQMGYPLERLRAPRPLLERVAVFARPNPNSVLQPLTLELCRLLGQRGQHVLIHTCWDDRKACAVARDLYHRQEVDAALFVGSRAEPEGVDVGDLPCVFVGDVPAEADGRCWQALVDNEGGGRAAGEHLRALGHDPRRVGFVATGSNPRSSDKRLRGLASAWSGADGDPAAAADSATEFPAVCVSAITEAAVAAADLPGFLARRTADGEPLTALFCYNDYLAGAALRELRRAGLSVPGDVSVVGFDDAGYAALLDPPLTTVVHPVARLAEEAADLLLLRLRQPDAAPQARLVPARLVARGSTAAPARR